MALGTNIFAIQTVFADNIQKYQSQILNKKLQNNLDKLSLIDNYQTRYFAIIKRNNVLLNAEDEKNLNKDRKELKRLFREVKRQISNKSYLKEYGKIEKKYSKCDEITTTGINDFAQNNHDEIDALLNKVYKEIKIKISLQDFKKLSEYEQKWLNEVNSYEEVYNSMDFGTIGTSIYYDYQTNMKSFRTLLLMLYL